MVVPKRLVPSLATAGEGEDGGVPIRTTLHELHIDPIPAFPCRQGKGHPAATSAKVLIVDWVRPPPQCPLR